MKSSQQSRLLSRSAVTLFGQVAPMLVALITIPKLISGLGIERFGILTLAWLVIGYFSLFDLGLSRALTQLVASKLGVEEGGLPATARTALIAMLGLGLVGAVVMVSLTPTLISDVFKIPSWLAREALHSFFILGASIPAVVVTAGLIGILTAYSRFDLINWIRVPLGISNYVIPIAVLQYTQSLPAIVGLLSMTRLAAMIMYWRMCLGTMPGLGCKQKLDNKGMKALLRFGGWMTISNIVSPLMVYIDRFVIGSIVSVAAVSYYATPFEMVTKLLIVPAAVVTVLFPALTIAIKDADRSHLVGLFKDGCRYVAITVFPAVLAITAFGHEGMTLWLGPEFAAESTTVLQLLAIGVLVNAFAHLPFTVVQSAGRPDITAKLHVAELLIYLPCLLGALNAFGIVGAALTWVFRVSLDAVLLSVVTIKLVPETQKTLIKLALFSLAAIVALATLILLGSFKQRTLLFSLISASFIWISFRYDLVPDQLRAWVRVNLASLAVRMR